jgi:hypothetical protein
MWTLPGVNLTLRGGGATQLSNNNNIALQQQQMMMIQSLTRQVRFEIFF